MHFLLAPIRVQCLLQLFPLVPWIPEDIFLFRFIIGNLNVQLFTFIPTFKLFVFQTDSRNGVAFVLIVPVGFVALDSIVNDPANGPLSNFIFAGRFSKNSSQKDFVIACTDIYIRTHFVQTRMLARKQLKINISYTQRERKSQSEMVKRITFFFWRINWILYVPFSLRLKLKSDEELLNCGFILLSKFIAVRRFY